MSLVCYFYMQGDRLELECVYQTVNRSAGLVVSSVFSCVALGICCYTHMNLCPVQGGQATSDEMCVTFLVYYPRAKLASCTSEPTDEAWNLFLK